MSSVRHRTVAIIPARGGSRRIPRKNLMPLAGVPLVVHSILHAQASMYVDEVIVSTDDDDIAAVSARAGAAIVRRPSELASDEATSESAVIHALDTRRGRGAPDPDLVVFLQCTSPIRRRSDIDEAIQTRQLAAADTLFSACPTKRFLWAVQGGEPVPVNYDYRRRLREQQFSPQFQENGSIYVFTPGHVRSTGNRLGGRMAIYAMDPWSGIQIDAPEDFELCEWVCQRPEYRPDPGWPVRIDLVVFDFDGVMTDNRVIVASNGDESVVCNRADGLGLERLRRAGVAMVILSKEKHDVVAVRAAKLGIECVSGLDDKGAALRQLVAQRSMELSNVVYVGNDINDLPCLEIVGLPVAPVDAHPLVRRVARLLLRSPGGGGAVRELCDHVLERLSTSVTA